MENELKAKNEKPKTILSLSNVTKDFDGIKAVNNLTMELESGMITSLIGPNGAGKTTVFNLITGLIKPDKGKILLNGKNITKQDTHKIARLGITRTFQNIRLFPQMTVLDNMQLATQNAKGETLMAALFQTKTMKTGENDNETDFITRFAQ